MSFIRPPCATVNLSGGKGYGASRTAPKGNRNDKARVGARAESLLMRMGDVAHISNLVGDYRT